MASCWLDGQLVKEEEAKISIFDHGLLYGDGVFEGIRFYNKQAFRLEKHLKRLQNSAAAIALDISFSEQDLINAISDVIHASKHNDGYIRLVVTRGKGCLGVNTLSCEKSSVFMIAEQMSFVKKEVLEKGAKLIIASTRRLSADGLDPRIKSLNYLNNILARMEANNAKADEAIMLNAQGYVTEGSTDNIFIVRDNKIITPAISDGVLEGITRDIIFEIAAENGLSCEEKTLSTYDLYTADECFLTGTAMELVPVAEIDGRKISSSPGTVFKQCQSLFKEKISKETTHVIDNRAVG